MSYSFVSLPYCGVAFGNPSSAYSSQVPIGTYINSTGGQFNIPYPEINYYGV